MPYKPMPKSEMVDRIAKAMWEDSRFYPARTPYDDTHDWDDLWKESEEGVSGEDFNEVALVSGLIGSMRRRARIALDTLREPSKEMKKAGQKALLSRMESLSAKDATEIAYGVWLAMINASYTKGR